MLNVKFFLKKVYIFFNNRRSQASIILPTIVFTLSVTLLIGWIIIPNSAQIYGVAVHRVKTDHKVVALTFDDGPNPPFTDQILDILKKHDVKATFFVVGERCQMYPDVVRRVYKLGHELGNHSWSHHVLILKSSKFIRHEIEATDNLIRELGYTGEIPFRSPKGMKLVALPKILKRARRDNVLFDVVGWDWRCPGVGRIVKNVVNKVRPGSIILLHDGNGDDNSKITDRSQTVEAVDIIIQKLKGQGYRFVTVSELMLMGKKR